MWVCPAARELAKVKPMTATNTLIRDLDALDAIDLELPPAGVVLVGEAARAQDASVAVRDADTVAAAMAELLELIKTDRHDAANVQDIATDVLPRLAALQAFIAEQVAEVTR
jgi:hypothetical protein